MHKYTVITPRGKQEFSTEGRYISGTNVQTSARTAESARLAVFSIAGERDAAAVRVTRWAASIVFFALRNCKPSTPPTAHTEALRMQHHMMQITGQTNPNRAHDVLMAEWLAKHPVKSAAPAPEPRRFAAPQSLAA